MNSAYVICTEPGRLESESMLLAASIRKFGGAASDWPILSYQPRATGPLAPRTMQVFEQLDVTHRQVILNTEFTDFPLANKPLSAAHIADTLEYENLVLLDGDKIFLAEPTLLLPPMKKPAAVRPVHKKIMGTTGTDENAQLWKELYEAFGLTSRRRVNTTLHGENIQAYWNSGLVAAQTSSGLFQRWSELLQQVLRSEWKQRLSYFAEQIALAMAIDSLELDVEELPPAYNYPGVPGQLGPNGVRLGWNDLVTLHYHKIFYKTAIRPPLHQFDENLVPPSRQWLQAALNEYGVYKTDWLSRSKRFASRSRQKLSRRLHK